MLTRPCSGSEYLQMTLYIDVSTLGVAKMSEGAVSEVENPSTQKKQNNTPRVETRHTASIPCQPGVHKHPDEQKGGEN